MTVLNARIAKLAAMLVALCLAACGGETDEPRASGGSMAAGSSSLAMNEEPVVSHVSFVPAAPKPGQSVQAVAIATDPDGDSVSLSYEWSVGGRRVLSDGDSYEIPVGWRIRAVVVVVTASAVEATSDPVSAKLRVANRAPRVTELAIETVDLVRGPGKGPHWRVSPTAADPDGDFVTFSYQWLVNGRPTDQTGDSFAKSRAGRGDEVAVRVTATDGQATSVPLLSPAIALQNASPVFSSAPPAPEPGGQFRYLPAVEDPDGDTRFSFRLLEGPDAMTLDTRTGELSWRPDASRPGRYAVTLEVADEHGATSTQRFEIAVRVGGGGAPAAPR
jgi:hypothetical protein